MDSLRLRANAPGRGTSPCARREPTDSSGTPGGNYASNGSRESLFGGPLRYIHALRVPRERVRVRLQWKSMASAMTQTLSCMAAPHVLGHRPGVGSRGPPPRSSHAARTAPVAARALRERAGGRSRMCRPRRQSLHKRRCRMVLRNWRGCKRREIVSGGTACWM